MPKGIADHRRIRFLANGALQHNNQQPSERVTHTIGTHQKTSELPANSVLAHWKTHKHAQGTRTAHTLNKLYVGK
jgi:hypothetical protein